MKVDIEQIIPIKMWLDDIEDGAMAQARRLADLPFAFSHVAIMPDAHLGYGMPIGGVLATKGVVIPNAVGVDIGCGMLAMKTTLQEVSERDLKAIMSLVRRKVPVGFKRHNTSQEGMPVRDNLAHPSLTPIVDREYSKASKSLGTLGGGNHFIEFQKDEKGFLWVMIHSGSRNLGKQVADHYNKVAKDLNETWFSSVPKGYDLAFLPLDSNEGQHYIHEMNYCVEYAYANRMAMLDEVRRSISDVVIVGFQYKTPINIAHNYAQWENHFGKNVMVHRKGATSARKGEVGVIPGSQGTASYIVEGLGNPPEFQFLLPRGGAENGT
jgi:tRNA-splicing ligase RtcB